MQLLAIPVENGEGSGGTQLPTSMLGQGNPSELGLL
jgi:hypothetical protein